MKNNEAMEWIDELEITHALLQREATSACGMQHENIVRDAEGLPIIEVDEEDDDTFAQFVPECSPEKRHMGCPHLYKRPHQVHDIFSTLGKIIDKTNDPELLATRDGLQRVVKDLDMLDNEMRRARTGTTEGVKAGDIVPTEEEAAQRAVSVLKHHEQLCWSINRYREEALEKVKAALEVAKTEAGK